MRLTGQQVLQGLQDDDANVRQNCLEYFTEALSEDNSVMPAVITAVDLRGSDAFQYLHRVKSLSQSDTTIEWAIQSLKRNSRYKPKRNHADFREELLAGCRGDLLLRHRDEILAELPRNKHAMINRRIESLSKAPEQLWSDLQSLCEKNRSARYISKFPMDEAEDLVVGLANSRSVPIDEVVRLLRQNPEDGSALDWLQPFLIQLLGRIRYEAALPLLLDNLRFEGDLLCDEIHSALVRIGTDQVVIALAERFPQEEWHWQNYACDIFGKIHSDESVRQAGMLLQDDSITEDIHERLAHGLASQFSTEGLEAIAKYLDSHDEWVGDYDWTETFTVMRCASKLMNFVLPNFDSWQQRMNEALAEPDDGYDEFDDDLSDDDFRDHPIDTVVHEMPRVGRNDPCPCGSGKKFKKCCLGKYPTD